MKGVLITAPETIPVIANAIDKAISEIEKGLDETTTFKTGLQIENEKGKRFIVGLSAILVNDLINDDICEDTIQMAYKDEYSKELAFMAIKKIHSKIEGIIPDYKDDETKGALCLCLTMIEFVEREVRFL
jgi:hypothetical protein